MSQYPEKRPVYKPRCRWVDNMNGDVLVLVFEGTWTEQAKIGLKGKEWCRGFGLSSAVWPVKVRL